MPGNYGVHQGFQWIRPNFHRGCAAWCHSPTSYKSWRSILQTTSAPPQRKHLGVKTQGTRHFSVTSASSGVRPVQRFTPVHVHTGIASRTGPVPVSEDSRHGDIVNTLTLCLLTAQNQSPRSSHMHNLPPNSTKPIFFSLKSLSEFL